MSFDYYQQGQYPPQYPPGPDQQGQYPPGPYQQYPGYYQPPRPSTLPAYLSAALFLGCALLSLVFAILSWDGTGNANAVAAVIGVLYTERATGNIDFGITMTMSVACTTATFAVILFARLGFARWFLAGLGGLVTAYYACAIVYLLAHHGARFVGLPLLALLLWAAATAMALLPFTAHAMRRFG